jgi:hypothetical protein
MKKQFVAIEKSGDFNYIVDDLNDLINEMYECELSNGESFETVKQWFFENHIVFESDSEIKEVIN